VPASSRSHAFTQPIRGLKDTLIIASNSPPRQLLERLNHLFPKLHHLFFTRHDFETPLSMNSTKCLFSSYTRPFTSFSAFTKISSFFSDNLTLYISIGEVQIFQSPCRYRCRAPYISLLLERIIISSTVSRLAGATADAILGRIVGIVA
jgi:hypothetical protein